ncbi:hypothetical protein Srot_0348 [Segniliparus rotundus DSM 44985]|uniref:Uncharacterized protein n=1 Tax=Segniliparus rotundus (strain ATCC BAA-972 / CDC 1076 / CIP 108378 / DSM 44985 / JCM 13578) TaxID=640132 RepID=D6ZB76_SEGRD|nr:hypothetical protein [Segniliparus rotundus]ADG96835.1 hypothetical protein Srot_0348 [Segniliparus rotundus DSM 44985]
MDAAEQLYHLQRENQKQIQQLQHDTTQGFAYLRKSAEASARGVRQSLSATGPVSSRSADRGWDSSTRDVGGPTAPQQAKPFVEPIPAGAPAELRNILIRNQHMELRWQREFAARLRRAGEDRAAAPQRQAGQVRQAEQRRAAQPDARKGRGWDDSTRRIGWSAQD